MNELNQTKSRPTSLTVLATFSLIGNTLMILGYIIILTAAGVLDLSIEYEELNTFLEQGYEQIIPQFVSVVLAFTGVIMMLRQKKSGFFIYVGAQILWLVFHHGVFNVLFTGLFIFFYALHYKYFD